MAPFPTAAYRTGLACVLPLEAVRDQVEQALLQKLSDDWLRLRLRELRAEFEIVVPGRAS